MEQNMNYKPVGYSSTNQSNSGQYNLSDNQYSQLGKDAWAAGNNPDFYSKGWLNLGDYGGSDKYQFAYDDSQNIGFADTNDPMRYLYVRETGNPNNYQKYSLGSSQDGNIDMAQLGRQLYGGGNNMLDNFWGNYYNWSQQSGQTPAQQQPGVQPPTYSNQPPLASPGGIRQDQGVTPTPGGGARVPGTGVGTPVSPEDSVNAGMGAAWEALQNYFSMPQYYPGWYGEDYQTIDTSKWQNAYPEFQAVPGYEGINIPDPYQGLMEGDYNRLENSLRTPGEIAAQNAFKQGGDYLKNVMGGQGMYGSSVMGNQANTGLNQKYMDTMASNAAQAAASRYGLQQSDLQFGANNALQRGDLLRQDALDQYKAAMTQRNLLNDYNNNRFQFDYGLDEAARGERNNLLQNRFQYDLAAQQWRNALNENLMNAGLAFAGKGGNLSNANRAYDQQQQQYNDQKWGNYARLGYELFDRAGGWDWAKDGASSLWDKWGW